MKWLALLFGITISGGVFQPVQMGETAGGSAWTPALSLVALDSTQTASDGGSISCLVPCTVFGDVTGSTWSEGGDPMHFGNEGIRWDWGEDGTWTLKGQTVQKDIGKGHTSGMVYTTAGTKNLVVTFTDLSGNTDTATATITVSEYGNAEATFECFGPTGETTLGAECPAWQSTLTIANSVSDLAGEGCFNSAKKCLLLAGQTYTGTTISDANSGCNLLGRHSTGARPILDYNSADDVGAEATISNSCLTLQGVEMTGNGTTGDTDNAFTIGAGDGGLAIIDVLLTPNTWHTGILAGDDTGQARLAVWDSTFTDTGLQTSVSNGGTNLYFFGDRLLVGGSTLTDVADSGNTRKGEHAVRVKGGDWHSWRGTTVGGAADNKSDWTYRAKGSDVNSYLTIHDSVILQRVNGFNAVRSGASGIDEQGAEYLYLADNYCEMWSGTRAQGENACFSFTPGQQTPSASDNSFLRHVSVFRTACDANGSDTGSSFACVKFDVEGNATDSYCDTPASDCFNFDVFGTVIFNDQTNSTNGIVATAAWQTPEAIEDITCGNHVSHNAGGAESVCSTGGAQTSIGGNVDSAGTDPFDLVSGEPTDWPSLRITPSSAAFDAGADLIAAGFPVSADRFGNVVPQGAASDAGVHEATPFPAVASLVVMGDTQSHTDHTFGGSGASGQPDGTTALTAMLQGIVNAAVDGVFHVGDVVDEPGSADGTDDWANAETAFADSFDASGIQLWTALGNHDYDTWPFVPDDTHADFDTWRDARTDPSPSSHEVYIEQITTDWHVLQFHWDASAADITTAEGLLDALPSTAKVIALTHHCAHPNTRSGNAGIYQDDDPAYANASECIWLETRDRVRVVIGGHWVETKRSTWAQYTVGGKTVVVASHNCQATDNDAGANAPGGGAGCFDWALQLDLTATSIDLRTWNPEDNTFDYTGRELWGGTSITNPPGDTTYTVDANP